MSQSINSSVNKPISQLINQSINQSSFSAKKVMLCQWYTSSILNCKVNRCTHLERFEAALLLIYSLLLTNLSLMKLYYFSKTTKLAFFFSKQVDCDALQVEIMNFTKHLHRLMKSLDNAFLDTGSAHDVVCI